MYIFNLIRFLFHVSTTLLTMKITDILISEVFFLCLLRIGKVHIALKYVFFSFLFHHTVILGFWEAKLRLQKDITTTCHIQKFASLDTSLSRERYSLLEMLLSPGYVNLIMKRPSTKIKVSKDNRYFFINPYFPVI